MKNRSLTGLRLGTLVGLLLLASLSSQPGQAGINLQESSPWQDIQESSLPPPGERVPSVQTGRYLSLDLPAMQALLAGAPLEAGPAQQAAAGLTVALPMPDGTFQRFELVESPVMEPGLAAKYPQTRTYAGQGLDDPTATTRLDITLQGFHAVVFSSRGTVYIDPVLKGDTRFYVSYDRSAYRLRPGDIFSEPGYLAGTGSETGGVHAASGAQLRTYRLALAATGEYTIYHGGTVRQGMDAIVTAVNRVNGIYEREVAVRMVLVENNDLVVYTDPATDPYTNNSGSTMLGQNQANLDAVIGSANYDIGHVFSTGGGGIATLFGPCNAGSKARGVTGLANPIGDPFYVDYVAHEMGHQFGAYHTFNGTAGSCGGNRTANSAYEPGSGSTIMAYAGICGTHDLQPFSDDYFHPISYDQIVSYTTTGSGNTCSAITQTGNHPPTILAGSGGFTIPYNTPFILTGSAVDPDNHPLTYAWDEMDLGPAGPPPPIFGYVVPPHFRSFDALLTPSRTFPQMSDIVNNMTTIGEVLPSTARTMKFRFTARDNRSGGGGVNFAEYTISVSSTAGPFQVTAPNTAVSWYGGTYQAVTWNVANTNLSPVSCSSVDIHLSTDGGYTYSLPLVLGTPNDGSETLLVPNFATLPTARVRVACVGHIFFDISNVNFTLTATPDLTIQKTHIEPLGSGGTITYTLVVSNLGVTPTSGMVTVLDTLPEGLTALDIYGSGWDCTLLPLRCTTLASLPVGASFPPITLAAQIGIVPSNPFTNSAAVSGGGDVTPANNTAEDTASTIHWDVFLPFLVY